MQRLLVFVYLLLGAVLPHALAAEVRVSDVWVRQNLPGQNQAGAFMSVHVSENANLVAAQSTASQSAELRQVRPGSMGRKQSAVTSAIPLLAGRANRLQSEGYYILLRNLKAPSLRPGEKIPIRLRIQGESGRLHEIQVRAVVRGLSAAR